ncbi:MAG TPA: MFS transporter [Acidimicrobiales bacterium]|nr:MFS transporter [Acidimicrobiales bacterium]
MSQAPRPGGIHTGGPGPGGGTRRGNGYGGAAGLAGRARSAGARTVRSTRRKLDEVLGGSERSHVILVLAAILALSSADASTVGASATELRHGLHIGNAEVGLLVSVSAAVGAVASVPFGVLVDRFRRITLLTAIIVLWGVAMVASSVVRSFGDLLLVRLFLGFVTAGAGPAVASLVGDYFAAEERGRIYGYILAGELLGAGVGFFITGDVAAISWRAAFFILSIPAFFLAWQVRRLPEPARGGAGSHEASVIGGGPAPGPEMTETQRQALAQGVAPDPRLILRSDPRRMNIIEATRYVLRVRTNMVLIVSSACAYFFMTGVQTFGLEFVHTQFGVGTVLASLLMLVVGTGAVLGVLLGGLAGDAWVRRGRIEGRMLVAGIAATATAFLFVPPLLTHGPMTALPYITAAAFCLTAQNPTLDAARLDIMPPLLWGRAEGIRTLLRAGSQSLAPVIFGGVSDLLGFTHQGLRYTFLIMLLPLVASGIILLRGSRHYATDVATAAASRPAAGPAPG